MRPISSSGFATLAQTSCVTFHQGNQLNRIQNGLSDGSLTTSEATGLAAKQVGIAQAELSALADGSMDRGEFRQLRQMQREASRDIFEQRHNGSESAGAAGSRASCVEGHQSRQSTRIQNGLSDGSLTACEAGQLMGQQNRIAEAKGSAMADGSMDQAEFTQLRQLQREASLSIFNARHNFGISG